MDNAETVINIALNIVRGIDSELKFAPKQIKVTNNDITIVKTPAL